PRVLAIAVAAPATSSLSRCAPGYRSSSATTKGLRISCRADQAAACCANAHWMTYSDGKKKTADTQPRPAGAQRTARAYPATQYMAYAGIACLTRSTAKARKDPAELTVRTPATSA